MQSNADRLMSFLSTEILENFFLFDWLAFPSSVRWSFLVFLFEVVEKKWTSTVNLISFIRLEFIWSSDSLAVCCYQNWKYMRSLSPSSHRRCSSSFCMLEDEDDNVEQTTRRVWEEQMGQSEAMKRSFVRLSLVRRGKCKCELHQSFMLFSSFSINFDWGFSMWKRKKESRSLVSNHRSFDPMRKKKRWLITPSFSASFLRWNDVNY